MTAIKIKKLDLEKATESEWKMIHAPLRDTYMEIFPDEQEPSVDRVKGWLSGAPDTFMNINIFAMNEDESEVLGRINLKYRNVPEGIENPHLWIDVAKKCRGQGLAKKLLKPVVEHALDIGSRILVTETFSPIPAGEAFALKAGMKLGNTYTTNRLYMKDVDRELMKTWLNRLSERTDEFEIGFWHHPFPEEEIDRFVTLENDFFASIPQGDMDVKPRQVTADEIRHRVESYKKHNMESPIVYARHKETGVYAGFTNVIIDLNRKRNLTQLGTTVLEKYRNLGIGRALKAEMTLKLLEICPEAEFIETSTAKVNDPMLNLNSEMGYKHKRTAKQWQISVEKLKEYLEK